MIQTENKQTNSRARKKLKTNWKSWVCLRAVVRQKIDKLVLMKTRERKEKKSYVQSWMNNKYRERWAGIWRI